jgi:hypothetical protein
MSIPVVDAISSRNDREKRHARIDSVRSTPPEYQERPPRRIIYNRWRPFLQALPPRFPRLWRGFAKCTAGLGTAQLPNQDSSEAAPPSRLVGSFPMHLRNPFAKMPSISRCIYHPGSGQLQTYPCFWVVPGCRACSCTKQLPLRVKGTSNDDPQGVSWTYYMDTSEYIEPSCS